ncbi:hypothetical protein Tco_0684592 [Tanacetum coccineum]
MEFTKRCTHSATVAADNSEAVATGPVDCRHAMTLLDGTMASSMDPVTQSLPGSQSAPNVALKDKIEGQSEVQRRTVIKMPTFSKQVSPHIESKVKWLKTKFHIIDDMLKQSGFQWNDVEKKVACKILNFHTYHVSLSDDEGNDVEFKSKETQSASKISNARRMARKAKETFIEDKAPKKKRTSGNNFGPSLDGIDQSFRTFVEGFNATFATMLEQSSTCHQSAQRNFVEVKPSSTTTASCHQGLVNIRSGVHARNQQLFFSCLQNTSQTILSEVVYTTSPWKLTCSSLVLHQMTSDHNRLELEIQDHSNEQSSSKLVPKVVP